VTLFIGKIYEVEIVTKHLPSGKHTKLWKITIEIVNFPKKKKVIVHSFVVCLPGRVSLDDFPSEQKLPAMFDGTSGMKQFY
jgi:hypothetical protein